MVKKERRGNGDGSFVTRGNRLYWRKTVGKDEHGKPIRKEFSGTTQRECRAAYEAWLKVRENDLQPTVSPDIKLGKWLDMYLATYRKGTMQERSYTTLEELRASVTDKLCARKVIDITPIELQAEVNAFGANKSLWYCKKYVGLLRAAFKQAVINSIVSVSPAESIKPCGAKSSPRQTYSQGEMEQIIKHALTYRQDSNSDSYRVAGARTGAAIITLAVTGMRRGEMLGLKWSDIYSDKIIIRRAVFVENNRSKVVEYKTKTSGSLREIPTEPWLFDLLEQLPHSSEFIFCTKDGGLSLPRTFSVAYERFIASVGVRYLSPHCLRHTFATAIIDSGADLKTAAELLGHTDVATTAIYTHPDFVAKQRAVQAAYISNPSPIVSPVTHNNSPVYTTNTDKKPHKCDV